MFTGFIFWIPPKTMPKAKQDLIESKITQNGAHISDTLYTHVICDSDREFLQPRVTTRWISECLRKRQLVKDIHIKIEQQSESEEREETNILFQERDKVPKESDQDSEDKSDTDENDRSLSPVRKKINFACMSPPKLNENKIITDQLEILLTKAHNDGDQWRERGYSKAINQLKKAPKINSKNEAKFLGKGIKEKVGLILDGCFKVELTEKDNVLDLFCNLWGAGPVTAKEWYSQGLKSLDDLLQLKLTKQQMIGIKYYDWIKQRMPWTEAHQIVEIVRSKVNLLSSNLTSQVFGAGSYRRKKETCGDVDILITNCDLDDLLQSLSEYIADGTHQSRKFMGIFKIGHSFRRVDILVVPDDELASALLYFTGSDYFNRSMRLAAQKKGFALNEHGIFKNVSRHKREKLNYGEKIPTKTEKEIFDVLGMDYLEPEDRSI